MRVHYLQHVPFEPPAAIADWASERGHDVDGSHLHEGDPLPDPGAVDFLVVMGGPMGVDDTDEYPWLADERRLVADVLDAGGRVLGVCLGAQQLAAALGAAVSPHETTEIGWFPIDVTADAAGTPMEHLPDVVFHWHGDSFELPAGATLGATSEACRTQAFVAADGRALGLQFHVEVTPETVEGLVAAVDGDPGEGPYVQSADRLLADDAPYEELRESLYATLDDFVA